MGGGVATTLLGPISDIFGRYKILVVMQLLASFSAIACGFSNSAEMLIVWRFVFGFMGAGAGVLSYAMLSDAFERRVAAKYMAYMTSVLTFSLIIAPLLGGVIVDYKNWRWCFFVLGIFNFIAFLFVYFGCFETLNSKKEFKVKTIINIYKHLILDKIYLRLILIPALMLGGLMLFLSNAPFYFITEKGFTPEEFGIQQSIMMGANFIASFIAGRLMEKIGVRKITEIGFFLMILGSIIGIYGAYYSDLLLIIGFIGFTASLGLSFAGYTSLSLERHKNEVGTASAMNAFLRSIVMGIGTGLASFCYNGTLKPTMIALAFIVFINIFLYLGCYTFIHLQKSS